MSAPAAHPPAAGAGVRRGGAVLARRPGAAWATAAIMWPLPAGVGLDLPLALIMLPTMGLLTTSGVMFPITSLPGAGPAGGLVLPLKRTAQGPRAALLPDSARRRGGRLWKLPMVAAALTAWTVVGFLLAVPLPRRAARRESGSRLTARRPWAAPNGVVSTRS